MEGLDFFTIKHRYFQKRLNTIHRTIICTVSYTHLNRNMKTANTVFSAAIQPLQARPDSLEHILEYQNQFYYVGGKVPEKECVDKTENENYYLLTLAALAQEMRCRGLTDASVKMGEMCIRDRHGPAVHKGQRRSTHFQFSLLHNIRTSIP